MAKRSERPKHDLLANRSGLSLSQHWLGWALAAARGFRALPAGEADLLGHDLRHLFGVIAVFTGFFLASAVALGKSATNPWIHKPSEWPIFVLRGSPLFTQFFFAYFLLLSLKAISPILDVFTSAWLPAKSFMVLYPQFPRAMSRRRMFRDFPAGAGSRGSSGSQCCGWHGPPTRPRHFLLSCDNADVSQRFPRVAAARRCAVSYQLFRGQDVQSLLALPDPCRVFSSLYRWQSPTSFS